MSIPVVRILKVGSTNSQTEETLRNLAVAGWAAHSVATVCLAETVLKTVRFKIVLAAERLPDGSGYDLTSLLERQRGTLFISVPLSETCLWLPVVEGGVRALGKRALNPIGLESELWELLRPIRMSRETVRFDFSAAPPMPENQSQGAPTPPPIRSSAFPGEAAVAAGAHPKIWRG